MTLPEYLASLKAGDNVTFADRRQISTAKVTRITAKSVITKGQTFYLSSGRGRETFSRYCILTPEEARRPRARFRAAAKMDHTTEMANAGFARNPFAFDFPAIRAALDQAEQMMKEAEGEE